MTNRKLKAAVEAAREGHKRARLSANLKREIGAYCAQRRGAGARWAELVDELGLGENQLRVWSGGARRGAKLQRVQVVADPPRVSLCLELPGAARITGLSVTDVAALLRELR